MPHKIKRVGFGVGVESVSCMQPCTRKGPSGSFFLFLISIVSFPHARTVAGLGFASSSWGTGHGRLAARERKAHPVGDGGGWPAGPRRSCPGLDEGATRAVPWPGAGRTLRRATASPTGDVCWPSGTTLCDVAKWRGREGRAEEKDEGGAHLVKDQRVEVLRRDRN
jgi:hypothetical protein